MQNDGTPGTPSTPARANAGSVLLLVAVLLAAFGVSLFQQINAHREASASLARDGQSAVAAVLAERVNTGLAQAWGASASAAEALERSEALRQNPRVIAEAAARARSVRAVVVFDETGAVLALTRRTGLEIASGALRASGGSSNWAGAAQADGQFAPAIVRRSRGLTIVTVLDAAALMAGAPENLVAFLLTADGALLHASAPGRDLDLGVETALTLAAPDGRRERARFVDVDGAAWVIGAAQTTSGGFRVLVAAPTRAPASAWLAALAQFALLGAAPVAAVGALVIMRRQDQRRVKIAEQEAERAATNFQLAADSARAGVFEWRVADDVFHLSEQAAAMLRTGADTLSQSQFIALAIAQDQALMEEELARARRAGTLDLRFRVAVGASLAWIEARGVAVEDRASGDGAIRFMGSVLDDTPRHAAQLRVNRLERQLRTAIDSFTGPFALWDAKRRLMMWNGAYVQAFNLAPETIRARISYETVAVAASAHIRRERIDPVDPQVREIELVSGAWLQLIERRTTDGGLITIGVDITAIKRQEEALKRNDKSLRELVARLEKSEAQNKQLAREAEEARRRAEDASRAKSVFLANMSHELRTPLTHIIGFSEIMSNELFGPIGNDQYRQYSKDIFGSGTHLLDLISDILDMAKIEAGKMTMSPRPLDPAEAIDQAVRWTRRRADEKSLQILVDAPDLPEIEADHRAVKQMLINLLSNAIKFTEEGAIMVRGRPTPEGVVLRVVDTGCGIPSDHLPRLAKPFEQVETELSRNHQGTGLGLALTKSLAEMHGGRLTIDSEVGKGTIVSIFLPRVFGGEATRTAAE